ncbi:PQQ-binding-like beta-propeller repeat protein [Patescibacteria group bacterium]|nr:PQQ-binding-like beta-propeller repeat protein [Patescibacteria group bacterium]
MKKKKILRYILYIIIVFLILYIIYLGNVRSERYYPNSNALNIYPQKITQQSLNSNKNYVFGNGYVNNVFSFNTKNMIVSTPSIVNGIAYFGANNNYVYAISSNTGKLIWKYKTVNQVMTQPIVVKGMVFVGAGNNFFQKGNKIRGTGKSAVYALSAKTGSLIWSHSTRGEDMPTFAYKSGVVYVANGNSEFYALSAKTGKTFWKRTLPGVVSMSSIDLSKNTAYIGVGNINTIQSLVALNIKTTKIVWVSPLYHSFGGATDNSAVSNRKYVVISAMDLSKTINKFNQVVYVINKKTGQIVWTHILGFGIRPKNMETSNGLIVGQNLYIGNTVGKGRLYSFNINSGKMNWRIKLYGDQKGTPVLSHGILYFGDAFSNFYAVYAKNGDVLGVHRFINKKSKMNGFTASDVALVNNEIYIGNLNGMLYAFPVNYLYDYPFELIKYQIWSTFDQIFNTRI